MIITWSKNLVTVSKCFLRVALRRYYKQACWHLAVVQEGLGPPSPPTHYLTPLTARTEATIQGDVLQNTFRLFLCLLKRGFSPSIRNWAFWLALIYTFCTKHWTFQFQVILHLLRFLVQQNTALFSTFRPSVLRHRRDISTFLDILTVSTMKTIYFLNAYHLGW